MFGNNFTNKQDSQRAEQKLVKFDACDKNFTTPLTNKGTGFMNLEGTRSTQHTSHVSKIKNQVKNCKGKDKKENDASMLFKYTSQDCLEDSAQTVDQRFYLSSINQEDSHITEIRQNFTSNLNENQRYRPSYAQNDDFSPDQMVSTFSISSHSKF